MENLQNRHDLTDMQWAKVEPIIIKKLDTRGGYNAGDNRIFVNACLWIVRTGAPWRDLPSQYGIYNAVHRRYKRWCDKHVWDDILAELIDEPDYEWLMIDASHVKVHPHAAGRLAAIKTWNVQITPQRYADAAGGFCGAKVLKGAGFQNSPCGGCEW